MNMICMIYNDKFKSYAMATEYTFSQHFFI